MGYTALSTSFSLLPFPFSVFISWLDHFDDTIDNLFAKDKTFRFFIVFACIKKFLVQFMSSNF